MVSKTVYDKNCWWHHFVVKMGNSGYYVYLDDVLIFNAATIDEVNYFIDKCMAENEYTWDI